FSMDAARGVIGLYPDPEKGPRGRELFMALGACLEHILIAAPALGYEVVTVVMPRGEAGPAALLRLKPLPEAAPESLFSTLLTRQSHAGKYLEEAVGEVQLDRLRGILTASSTEKIHLLTNSSQRQELVGYLHDLSHEFAALYAPEVAGWLRTEPEPPEGVPLEVLGLPISSHWRFKLLSPFGYSREILEAARQAILRQGHGIEAPAYLLMTTPQPGPRGYLEAGRAAARILLTLSEIELASQTLTLPLGTREGHECLREIFSSGPGVEPVLLLRLGKPAHKSWPRTFRRPLEDSLMRENPGEKIAGRA
ncbi:MAG TPA: hypothetical protein VMV05_06335, partial [bacterium]|nr:hypothetical protein [bacterium]